MQIIIEDMPSNRTGAVWSLPDYGDYSDDVHITKYEANGKVTKFTLTKRQIRRLPLTAPKPSTIYWESSPIPLPMVPYETGVDGHYWMTPNHVRRMKEIVG